MKQMLEWMERHVCHLEDKLNNLLADGQKLQPKSDKDEDVDAFVEEGNRIVREFYQARGALHEARGILRCLRSWFDGTVLGIQDKAVYQMCVDLVCHSSEDICMRCQRYHTEGCEDDINPTDARYYNFCLTGIIAYYRELEKIQKSEVKT